VIVKKNRLPVCGLDTNTSGWRPAVGSFEHGNIPSGSIKGGEFIDQPSAYHLSRTLLREVS